MVVIIMILKLLFSGITHTGHVLKTITTDERTRVYGNFALNYKPTEWLNIMGRVTADTYTELREERIAVGSVPQNLVLTWLMKVLDINEQIAM